MMPNKEGIWEWFDTDGTKRLVAVYDVNTSIRDTFPAEPPYWRVYWWGGYYNIYDEHDAEHPEYDHLQQAEWPETWGKYVGPHGSVEDKDLYLAPTPEQLEKIHRLYEKNS